MRWQDKGRFAAGVYFVQCNATGYVKIGYSAYVGRRVQDLNQQSVRGVRLLYAYPGTRECESAMHRRCQRWAVHGEWHKPTRGLFEIIAEKRAAYGPRSLPRDWRAFAKMRKDEDVDAVLAANTLLEAAVEMLAAAGLDSSQITEVVNSAITDEQVEVPCLE